MAIIDKKGRLFGKVNLLDLVVVLAVLAVAGRFGYKALRAPQIAATGVDKPIQMTFILPHVRPFTMDVLQPGEEIYDSKSNTHMGRIVEVNKEPARVLADGNDGRLYERVSDWYFDYYVTVEGPARVSPNGITMSGIEVKVGRKHQFKTALWAGEGTPVVLPPAR